MLRDYRISLTFLAVFFIAYSALVLLNKRTSADHASSYSVPAPSLSVTSGAPAIQ